VTPVARIAAVGVCVRSLDRGDELYARNADLALTPASNQKLLVAAAALDRLGPDHRFTTRVLAIGSRRGSVLQGDLVLQGGGDPTLTTDGLSALAGAVVARGIRRITGRVRGDDSVFDRERLGIGWAWDDLGSEDGPPISGLTLNENGTIVRVQPGARPGLRPLVRLIPAAARLEIRNRARTAPAGERGSLEIGRPLGRDTVIVSGGVPLQSPPRDVLVTVEEPALYAAAVFTAVLRERGVRVAGPPVLLGTPGAAVLLGEQRSPPLAEIVRRMDKPSDNLYAETLLKAIGVPEGGLLAGTGAGGAGEAVLRRFLARIGWPGPLPVVADGSGLSRFNLVSARCLTQLLAAMDHHPAREPFFASLPIAGVDGTLRRRMLGTAAAGTVHAKTGSLTHVTALSGIVTTRDGERLAFSILTNNWPGPLSVAGGPRAMEDGIAIARAEYRRPDDQSKSARTMTRSPSQQQLTRRASARAICRP
jgi:D-alanyl-D-alanine carboxypeptidase/D-alanyl-D-alanine-endopeptidase (penicillin-binding protein 4)